MMGELLVQTLWLLGSAVVVLAACQRLRIPSSLGYLLVGIMLGPHTAGPVVEAPQIHGLAEFGIVFLLFTIGLSFSPPQLSALGAQVLRLGVGQVVLSTLVVALLAWLAGQAPAAAFIIGAVFAQSSTTIISRQLAEQGEEQERHARLGTALSVFQDVTSVPFIVVIPVLGSALGLFELGTALLWAMAKAALALVLVFVCGRWLLGPLFRLVAARRSAELFTLAVLFVSLIAAWTTASFGLSMAFGAFLAGMMLGETEFRHQIEASIRPFRDVLLGLFFVGVGMLFEPAVLPAIWPEALLGALLLLASKSLLVALLVHRDGGDALLAWRTGLLLAVGGEFGFALLALGLEGQAIDPRSGQIVLAAVLFSMFVAPLLIRYNAALARLLTRRRSPPVAAPGLPHVDDACAAACHEHVILCGYGRVGQSIGRFLEEEGIAYVALDLDPLKVREAHLAGEPVFYGDASERSVLEAVGVDAARLLVVSCADADTAHKVLLHARALRPGLPVMVRTRDESHVDALRSAGATEVVPETFEATLMIAAHVLVLLSVPLGRVLRRVQAERACHYRLLREFFDGGDWVGEAGEARTDRLRAVLLPADSPVLGQPLGGCGLEDVTITALVRAGERQLAPSLDTCLCAGDTLVLFGSPESLQRAERLLLP